MRFSAARVRQVIRHRLAGEVGTIVKDWGGRLPVALIFANRYRVAMSNLGFQTLYGLFNTEPDVVCERVTWEGPAFPPISYESERALGEFPVWAFSVPFELDYFHLVSLIRQAGVPLWAAERGEGDPILLGGGLALSANPEPVAPFLDAVVVGEAEPVLGEILAVLRAGKGVRRAETLAALAQVKGVYVPAHHDGRPVARQWAADLAAFATSSVVLTRETEFGDAFLIEIARGCRWGCRFCLAGHMTRPPRFRSLAQLRPQIEQGLRYRRRVGLVGAAVSDHPELEAIVRAIADMGGGFTVASLRADQLTPAVLQRLRGGGTRTLTLAPEVGAPGLADVIDKGFGREELLRGVDMARAARLRRLKLYFMVGLPWETRDDVEVIVELALEARERLKPGQVSLSVAPFVPKAHTPFQWAAMAGAEELAARLGLLQRKLRPLGVAIEKESVDWSRIQGVLARGDRRLGPVLAGIASPSLAAWRSALAAAGLREEEYLRERAMDEAFPWEIVDPGVSRAYLCQEWGRARQSCGNLPCPPGDGCQRCGVCGPGAEA